MDDVDESIMIHTEHTGGRTEVGTIDASLNQSDMKAIIAAELDYSGIAGHHIDSLNDFYSVGIKQIITDVFQISNTFKNVRDMSDEDKSIAEISYLVEFTDVDMQKPQTVNELTGAAEANLPIMCQRNDHTYSAIPYISARITATAIKHDGTTIVRTESFDRYRIAPILCGTYTNLCHLTGMDAKTLDRLGENYRSPGGTFYVNGTEWSIDNLSNITYNSFHAYRQSYANELARGTYLSKPGDAFENSYQTLLRYLNTGAITVEVTTNKFKELNIPFYLLFRACGITSDRDIVDNIVEGVDIDDVNTNALKTILEQAFRAEDSVFNHLRNVYSAHEIISGVALKISEIMNPTNALRDENVQKYINTSLLQIIDRYIFPHIGSKESDRVAKMRFLAHLIRKLLLTAIGVLDSTDRDSLENKRIFAGGPSLAKTFKTDFNFAVVQTIRKALLREFRSVPFSAVKLVETVKQSIKNDDLERMLVQAVVNGNKVIVVRRNEVTNRMSTQIVQYKNDLNVISIMRSIASPNTSASKQNERADEMRRVRPDYPGSICVTQSPDTGEGVGTSMQMAAGTTLSRATSSYVLKQILRDDADLMLTADVLPRNITLQKLSKVFVNGDWIGCVKNSTEFARKYRGLRRSGKIHRSTTILWKLMTRELYFWCDIGRMLSPHIIVYNNWDEWAKAAKSGKPIQFKQWIDLTQQHLLDLRDGKINIENLIDDEIIERISADESKNTYVCDNLTLFREHANDPLNAYTHLDIEQSSLGLVALAGPMGNHSATIRNTMFTNHRKQAGGWAMTNYPFRIEKNQTHQWYCDRPLVSAMTDSFTMPNGRSLMFGVQCYTGRNCEDSLILNQNSIDSGMLTVTQYDYEQTVLETDETFGNPDVARTLGIQSDGSYEHVENGFVKVGTQLTKNTVLMVKSAKLPKPQDQYLYNDRSVVYRRRERARVEDVIHTRNSEDKAIGKVQYSACRPIGIGDKCSSKTANKGIVAYTMPAIDMPYTADGIILDGITNVHSFPSRMALNQIIETMLGIKCTVEGSFIDGTTHEQMSLDDAITYLAANGIKFGGHTRCYSGMTGEPMDTYVFCGPVHYQRLEKFVVDEWYAVSHGPTSAITGQPLDGRKVDGGLRVGEMETDIYIGQGASRALDSKFSKDSDGMYIYVCTKGHRAVVNEKTNLYSCKLCGDRADIVKVKSTKSSNLFMHEITAAGVTTEFVVEPFSYTVYKQN